MRKFLAVCIMTLTVCISLGHQSAFSKGLKNKRIGVISLLRDEFHSVYIGTTIFQNKTNFKKTAGWKFSSLAERDIIREINKSKKFTARKVSYKKSTLLRINLKSMGAFSSSEPYTKELQKIAGKHKLDFLLIISPVTLDLPLFKFNKIGEYGHYHLYNPILSDHLCTFIKYRLSLFDMKQAEIIDSRFTTTTKYGMGSSACSDKLIGGVPTRLPEGYTYKEKISAFPLGQMKNMKNRIRKQMRALLNKDLECLKLKTLKNGKFREDGCGIFD